MRLGDSGKILLLHESDYRAMTWRQRRQLRQLVTIHRTRAEYVKPGRALLFDVGRLEKWLYAPADFGHLFGEDT